MLGRDTSLLAFVSVSVSAVNIASGSKRLVLLYTARLVYRLFNYLVARLAADVVAAAVTAAVAAAVAVAVAAVVVCP